MKTRYVSYEFSACRVEADTPEMPGLTDHHVERCDEEDAQFFGVCGRNPDGTAQHIGDAADKDSAESFVALLNWLITPEVES